MDRNGKVDKKEMEKIIEAIYDLLGEEHRKGDNSPSERVKIIMHKLDKDQNGFVLFFLIFYIKFFSLM